MKTTIKLLLLAATTVVTACANTQPPVPCVVGHGGFAAQFTHVGGSTSGTCFRKGDIIGVQKYRQTDGTSDIYLKSVWLSEDEWFTQAPLGHDASGMANGKLSANVPADDGFCTVPTLADATGTDPNGDTLTYTWSNVRFFVSGTVPGTQFTANLTISDGGACSADYTVAAQYPVVGCEAHDVDDNPLDAPNVDACSESDHVWFGLTANPLFDSACVETRLDTDFGASDHSDNWGLGTMWLCVPAGPVPSVDEGTTL